MRTLDLFGNGVHVIKHRLHRFFAPRPKSIVVGQRVHGGQHLVKDLQLIVSHSSCYLVKVCALDGTQRPVLGLNVRALWLCRDLHACPLLVRLVLELLRLLRLALRLDLLLLQAENKGLDFFCVRGRAENLQRVVLQSLNPGLNIGYVLAWVMPYAQLVTKDHACDFSAQFFFGVPFRPERM